MPSTDWVRKCGKKSPVYPQMLPRCLTSNHTPSHNWTFSWTSDSTTSNHPHPPPQNGTFSWTLRFDCPKSPLYPPTPDLEHIFGFRIQLHQITLLPTYFKFDYLSHTHRIGTYEELQHCGDFIVFTVYQKMYMPLAFVIKKCYSYLVNAITEQLKDDVVMFGHSYPGMWNDVTDQHISWLTVWL